MYENFNNTENVKKCQKYTLSACRLSNLTSTCNDIHFCIVPTVTSITVPSLTSTCHMAILKSRAIKYTQKFVRQKVAVYIRLRQHFKMSELILDSHITVVYGQERP